ncbi:MAG: histidine kinase [Bacteroidetes bacterium]|nr:histidine kinase [Bacteroidota bacterium]
MNRLKFTLLFTIILFSLNFAQIKIKMIVKAEGVENSESVYIAGNRQEIGNWNPGATKFFKEPNGNWVYSFTIPSPDQLEFKFTKGSWSQEAANPDGTIPGNTIANAVSDTVLEFKICCWSKSAGTVPFKGQITGKVEYIKELGEGNILPRDIIILLPEGYEKSSDRYPVLYMHDGQNIFDPSTVGFGVDWQIDEAIDSLVKQGKVEKMIIVGIYNSKNRRPEYSHSKLGEEYMNFVVKKVKPLIDSVYRTKPGREFTYTAGSSMGGLISFMLLWEHNDVFSKAGSFSPALKIDIYDYVSIVKNTSSPKRNFKLYIDNGGKGLEAKLQPGIDEMIATLEELGYKSGDDFITVFDPEAEHNESAWAKRIPNFLIKMFGTTK